jgi:hypothetical protein
MPQFKDHYEQVRDLQNAGEPCPHCLSISGHYITCALLNRENAEKASRESNLIDQFFLSSLRINYLK